MESLPADWVLTIGRGDVRVRFEVEMLAQDKKKRSVSTLSRLYAPLFVNLFVVYILLSPRSIHEGTCSISPHIRSHHYGAYFRTKHCRRGSSLRFGRKWLHLKLSNRLSRRYREGLYTGDKAKYSSAEYTLLYSTSDSFCGVVGEKCQLSE